MKKALALVLSILVAFSMFAVAASAEGEAAAGNVVITFEYQTPGASEDEAVVKSLATITVAPGVSIPTEDVPQIATEFKATENGKKYKYTFKGWRSSADDQLYYAGTIKVPAGETNVTMVAEYSMEDISERQSFWNLIESIFERINLIFEYFAKVFNW